jgi:hypothetical protein
MSYVRIKLTPQQAETGREMLAAGCKWLPHKQDSVLQQFDVTFDLTLKIDVAIRIQDDLTGPYVSATLFKAGKPVEKRTRTEFLGDYVFNYEDRSYTVCVTL